MSASGTQVGHKKIKSDGVTRFSQISNEWLKSDVFSHRLNMGSDVDAVTSDVSPVWRGRKGIRPVETEWWGTGVVICL